MASADTQDFSTDSTTSPSQMNKYGFTPTQAYPHGVVYPHTLPMTGYYAPIPQNDNPAQDLMLMGFHDVQFTETSGTNNDLQNPYSFEVKLKGIDKTFYGVGAAKKKARKAAAQAALDFLSDPANVPEGLELKTPKKFRSTYMQPVPTSPWGQMAPLPPPPPGYMVPMAAPTYQHFPTTQPVKAMTPIKLSDKEDTPFGILREKYPDATWKSEVSCTVTVGEQEFSVALPGINYHFARMLACASALKELDGMEFPKWERKMERVQENSRNSSGTVYHPVSLLLKEYGSRNVSFKQDSIADPCTVTIKEAGESHVYSSSVMSNKRQAKYEAALLAIKELKIDCRFPNIMPFQSSEDRKRRREEPTESAANPEESTAEGGDNWGMEAEGEKVSEKVSPQEETSQNVEAELITAKSDPQPESKPVDPKPEPEPEPKPEPEPEPEPMISPTPEKRPRVEPPDTTHATGEGEALEERRQQTRSNAAGTTRFSRGRNTRGPRVLIRGNRGQVYGGYRGSQRYF